jgi:hypothetical protein
MSPVFRRRWTDTGPTDSSLTNPEFDDLMRLFERIVAAGKHLAVMDHFSHPRELEPDIAAAAVRRIRPTAPNAPELRPPRRHSGPHLATNPQTQPKRSTNEARSTHRPTRGIESDAPDQRVHPTLK